MSFDLEKALQKIAWFLPNQGPIKDFIHQNILLAYLDMPFEQALVASGKKNKARAYMDLNYYRDNFDKQNISAQELGLALDYFLPSELSHEREFFYHALFAYKQVNNLETLNYLTREFTNKPNEKADLLATIHACESDTQKDQPAIAELLTQQLGLDFDYEVHQVLFRLLGSYLDQGVSLWTHLDQWPSFQSAVAHEAADSLLPIAFFAKNQELKKYLELAPKKLIPELLARIIADENLYELYLEESLFAHPGWSGMIKMIAQKPETLASRRDINLGQMLAVKLALQISYINYIKKDFNPVSKDALEQLYLATQKKYSSNCLSTAYLILNMPEYKMAPDKKVYGVLNKLFLQKIWHHAMEQTNYKKLFALFSPQLKNKNHSPKKFQVVFCVDDRECSTRRLLENEDPSIETFGTAGFFGIDCYFKPLLGDIQKMCPANLSPSHVIAENPKSSEDDAHKASLLELAMFTSRHGANSTLLGLISTYTIGHLSLFSLLASMLHPFKIFRTNRVALGASKKDLIFEDNSKDIKEILETITPNLSKNLNVGYTYEEMAERVFATFSSMGMKSFAPLVFIVGHGSSSLNNPHFAAYDCQACSAHPGALNARVFAAMANLKPVRDLIAQRGLVIPPETSFIGGIHDTCSDDITFFDTENLSKISIVLYEQFLKTLTHVREKNAQERCERFLLVPAGISGPQALKEVQHRSHALFEPRPELGHAMNALAVVSRRSRISHINFQRRSFLQSYDHSDDPQGHTLGGILSAVVPVCGHINLDYYFSRLDPAIYGCGTKLSHNVYGLIGVGNGLDDDLRTGLPIQMTELHDPLRLLIIIEQHPEIIFKTLSANAAIFPWVKNEGVRVASLDPHKDRLCMFDPRTDTFIEVSS
jgi:uncharacterized protein YbcC (UPF0753/DUF2309 family)